jgi:hypothetical protein
MFPGSFAGRRMDSATPRSFAARRSFSVQLSFARARCQVAWRSNRILRSGIEESPLDFDGNDPTPRFDDEVHFVAPLFMPVGQVRVWQMRLQQGSEILCGIREDTLS